MRAVLIMLLPGLLTTKLNAMSVEQAHWMARKMGIYEGLHDFLHGMCPCDLGD